MAPPNSPAKISGLPLGTVTGYDYIESRVQNDATGSTVSFSADGSSQYKKIATVEFIGT